MKASGKSLRRWFGALCLLGALLLLVAGQTWLQGKITGLAFIGYWVTCLGLTLLAMLAALLDAWALRREGRARQRALMESTVQEILAARHSASDPHRPPPGEKP